MRRTMPLYARPVLAMTIAAVVFAPLAAHAQTTSSGPSVAQGQQTAPERWLHYGQSNAVDLGTQTRSNGLNPTGVNYSDCISDMTLVFPVVLDGFGTGNTDAMQIWATVSGTCTDDADRGNNGIANCWLVSEGLAFGQVFTGSTSYPIRVQDIVGPQQAPPNPPVLVSEGVSACSAQPSYAAVTITLWFLPLATAGTYDTGATALQWPLSTDLVGPPAPTGLTVGAGQTLLLASWQANTDSDTLGYDVFIDPPPGSLAQTTVTQVICPGSSSSGSSGSTSSSSTSSSASSITVTSEDDADLEDGGSAVDATAASTSGASSSSSSSTASSSGAAAADAACYTVNVAQSGTAIGSCSSTVLGSAMVQDSGVATVEDDAGEDAAVEEETGDSGPTTGVGGIATIPCQYAIGVGCATGSPIYTADTTTITGETNTAYTIKGLTDNVTYAVAVSAVDNSGNPGPPSAQSPTTCNYPAPVNDFYALYRDAGGLAGGGFCALRGGTQLDASSGSPIGTWIAAATGCTATLAAARRRRRRRK